MTRLLKCCTSTLLLCFTLGTHAGLVDNGSSTFDMDTGLEWLDLTETQGLSYLEALDSDYVTAQGYRHATLAEVETLFINAGLTNLTGSYLASQFSVTQLLLSLFGSTGENPPGDPFLIGWAEAGAADPDYLYGPFVQSDLGALAGRANLAINYNMKPNIENQAVGHYLIRMPSAGVPSPSTLAIFALGLGGLLVRLRSAA